MISIFDCSNSPERPLHRGGGGPITNDIIRYLKENCHDYGCQFVNIDKADIILTNDVIPKNILATGLPIVKRMCAPFWHKDFIDRNIVLNQSAKQADRVIFISEFSRKQYSYLYGENLRNLEVILHWVDPNIYNCQKVDKSNKRFTFAAAATNWNRKEKRLDAIIRFAELYPEINIILIGTLEQKVPDNIKSLGHISSPKEMAKVLNSSDAFINLSYRDAATKTIPQAISCHLPILFAKSGGVPELVGEYGVPINDDLSLAIRNSVPELSDNNIVDGFERFMKEFDLIKLRFKLFDGKLLFRKMLNSYFAAIKNTLDEARK